MSIEAMLMKRYGQPLVKPIDKINQQVEFLYTNIGRGHPFYLDGIIEAIIRSGSISMVRSQSDVFELSSGLSLGLWRLARWLYLRGSSDGIIGSLYARIRRDNNYDPESLSVRLLGRQLRAKYRNSLETKIVAHPLLVSILNEHKRLVYQHGEVVVPSEAIVPGAETVMVPTDQAAQPFLEAGYERSSIFVSGLCIEPTLVSQAETAFHSRIQRFEGDAPLTGAFYSSGAEPKQHVEALVKAAVAAGKAGNRVIVFAQRNGRLELSVTEQFSALEVPLARFDATTPLPTELPAALLVSSASRREESRLTAQLFPYFDYFVAPSHERTNWALGLGLPMFILLPTIGPFAPLNREILLSSGVAEDLGLTGARLERGQLLKMASSGWGNYPIDGFAQIADYITERIEQE